MEPQRIPGRFRLASAAYHAGAMATRLPKEQGSESSVSDGLHFDVSTGLKRVIGRDLITDDEVAFFELVKNAFDAEARHVQIMFDDTDIWVVDDGQGMTYTDIRGKWLFVAYSSKREAASDSFRERIAERTHYAGSKGIGRFSSDRLGRYLTLQTMPKHGNTRSVNEVHVDWQAFEEDEHQSFGEVALVHRRLRRFQLPPELDPPAHGTVLRLGETRVRWDRQRILHLKSALAKLINPFGSEIDGFKITIVAPKERDEDAKALEPGRRSEAEPVPNTVVNGAVGNFIFSTLREKTTYIDVALSDDGAFFTTELTDRGEVVFRIREPNPYERLRQSGFRCQIYYLNQSAKVTFARRMGVPSVRFGSVFLFRNGFRVYPIGEDGDDWFGIDARKQQGYARFLGTRDVIGRIDVAGSEHEFREASSRNQGLIESPAVRELRKCFWEHGLKRLERYVVPVSWADKGEKLADDLSRLMTDSGRARVATAVARLIDAPEIELLAYSQRLIGILNERSQQFEESIASLKAIADKTRDKGLATSIALAEQRFEELKEAEAEAQRIAAREREAKQTERERADEAEARARAVGESLEEERKRALFLTSLTSADIGTIVSMHHQITIYAADARQQLDNFMAAIRNGEVSRDEQIYRLEQLAFLNQKVLSIARLATKANFRLESDMIEADLSAYIEQYIDAGARPFLTGGVLAVSVDNAGVEFTRKFRPMEIAIVVDNLINNARKARATRIDFRLFRHNRSTLELVVEDDGRGFPSDIDDLDQIFQLGFSRTSGSGLGLYHVRQVLGEMGASISAAHAGEGAKFVVRFA